MSNLHFLNYWDFGLCPSSGILKTRKHSVSETGSVYVLRCGGVGTPTLLGPLHSRCLLLLTGGWQQTQFPQPCLL
jgi:hypothetical protein